MVLFVSCRKRHSQVPGIYRTRASGPSWKVLGVFFCNATFHALQFRLHARPCPDWGDETRSSRSNLVHHGKEEKESKT